MGLIIITMLILTVVSFYKVNTNWAEGKYLNKLYAVAWLSIGVIFVATLFLFLIHRF